MKKIDFTKVVYLFLIAVSIVNCILEIICIAEKLSLYNSFGTFNPVSLKLNLSFEIILNLLFVAVIILLWFNSYHKGINTSTKKGKLTLVFMIFIVSCLFIFAITNLCYQIQSFNLNIETWTNLIESGTPLSDTYQAMILKYEQVKASLIPLLYSNTILYLTFIGSTLFWTFHKGKHEDHLARPVKAE